METFQPLLNLRDTLLFAAAAIILGFLIAYIFRVVDKSEPLYMSISLFLLQLFMNVVIILLIFRLYINFFNTHPNTYLGLTVFIVILFTLQPQLLIRLSIIHRCLFNDKLITIIELD